MAYNDGSTRQPLSFWQVVLAVVVALLILAFC